MIDTLTLNRLKKVDPTATFTLREAFARDMARRFHMVSKDIYESVYLNNCFGLEEQPKTNEPIRKRRFQFSTTPEKHDEFMKWLDEETDNKILTVTKGEKRKAVGSTHWSDRYVGLGYKSGLSSANSKLKKTMGGLYPMKDRSIDAAFNVPFHADKVGLLYSRTFTDLKGITDDMDTIISRSLAEGLAEGRGPYQMARILMRRLDDDDVDLEIEDSMGRTISGIRRARTLARTEVIAAHAEASLNMFEEAGILGVTADVEFASAGDSRVCPDCEDLEGQVFSVEDARGIIPVHPLCRCAWLPVLTEEEEE